jgi:hypothetical protein
LLFHRQSCTQYITLWFPVRAQTLVMHRAGLPHLILAFKAGLFA